jgi:hypothetical protein
MVLRGRRRGATADADCTALRGGEGYGCADHIGATPLPAGACLPFSAGAQIGDECDGTEDCTLGGFCVSAPQNIAA